MAAADADLLYNEAEEMPNCSLTLASSLNLPGFPQNYFYASFVGA